MPTTAFIQHSAELIFIILNASHSFSSTQAYSSKQKHQSSALFVYAWMASWSCNSGSQPKTDRQFSSI